MSFAHLDASEVPSILEQTPWRAGLFNFGKASLGPNRMRFFNPSVVRKDDKDILLVRRAEDIPEHRFGLNSIWAFEMTDLHQPVWGKMIQFRGYKNQHFEDPRIIPIVRNRYLLSYTTFVMNVDGRGAHARAEWYGAHQQCAMLNDEFGVLGLIDPVYGLNSGSVMTNLLGHDGRPGLEKNWLWFEHDGALHTIYKTYPEHEVIRWGPAYNAPETVYKSKTHVDFLWIHGHARGGTPPIRIGNLYWSFFHSSTPWANGKRRYHMGAYAFSAKPPFRVRYWTPEPLLTGSLKDPWEPGQPLVVFPCGALLRDNKWFVTLGVNDMASAWIEIPHEGLERQVKEIPYHGKEAREEGIPRAKAPRRDSANGSSVPAGSGGCGVAVNGSEPAAVQGGASNRGGTFSRKKRRARRRRDRIGSGPSLRNDSWLPTVPKHSTEPCGAIAV